MTPLRILVALLALSAVATGAHVGGYGTPPAPGGYGPTIASSELQCAHAVRCTCETPAPSCAA